MIFLRKKFLSLILLLSILGNIGCVGVVKDKNPQTTKTAESDLITIPFSGISEARAISHDKVEVYFLEAPGLQKDYIYLIFVNNSQIPIEVSPTGLLGTSGIYLYTLTGLESGTTYSFSVGVRNKVTGEISNANKSITATTFNQITADFHGISAAYPSAGSQGTSKIIVEWIPVPITGSPSYDLTDVVEYEIRYINASFGTREDLSQDPIISPNVIVETIQNNIGDEKSSSFITQGIVAGESYYILVRAIHKAYRDSPTTEFKEINSKSLLVTTPTNDLEIDWPNIFTDENAIIVERPNNNSGRNNVIIKWLPGSGPFDSYRIAYYETATLSSAFFNPDYSKQNKSMSDLAKAALQIQESTWDSNIAPDPHDPLDRRLEGVLSESIDANTTYIKLTGLNEFSWYQLAVVLCKTEACTSGNRIFSTPQTFEVKPNIASFGGIDNILDPTVATNTDKINLTFDAILTPSTGDIDGIDFYCADPSDPTNESSWQILDHASAINSSGSPCHTLQISSGAPSNFTTLSSIEIQKGSDFIPPGSYESDTEYCFSAVPWIAYRQNGDILYDVSNIFYKEVISKPIVKCKKIYLNTPSSSEFPGLESAYTTNPELENNCYVTDDKITAKWSMPTSGIAEKFKLFWKKANGMPFKFSDAILEEKNGTHDIYDYTTSGEDVFVNPDSNTNDNYDGNYFFYDITDFESPTSTAALFQPGESYQVGILTYFNQGGSKAYSQANTGILTCNLTIPKAKFEEWVDIFAVGPKEDGRSQDGTPKYLFEKLNSNSQVEEVDVQSASNGVFDGVYGSKDESASQATLYQLSNRGIVRIAWRDVTLTNITGTPKLSSRFDSPALKKDRKYGYKVLRSDDNQKTWIDLTSSSSTFQKTENIGLIQTLSNYDDPNTSLEIDTSGYTQENDIIEFTDYSVKHAGKSSNGIVEQARVYFYKVIPVYNGVEISYDQGAGNSLQHVIKVVLPPGNMALVSRLMANRQTCKELGKSYSKNINQYYSCSYDGLGASSLKTPVKIGETVFDFGSDLLIDRFELGCNYTRGSESISESVFSGDFENFIGKNSSNGKFRGCLLSENASLAQTPGGNGGYGGDNKLYRVGDCIGGIGKNDLAVNGLDINNNRSQNCSISSHTVIMDSFFEPGLYHDSQLQTCHSNYYATNFFNSFKDLSDDTNGYSTYTSMLAQSEFLAVFYNRSHKVDTDRANTTLRYRGAGTTSTNKGTITWNSKQKVWDSSSDQFFSKAKGENNYHPASSCYINIPVQNAANKLRARWLPANSLDELVLEETGAVFTPVDNLLTKTVSTLEGPSLTSSKLFDSSENKFPSNVTTAYTSSYNNRYNNSTPLSRVISSNASKLPPLDGLDQDQANTFCQGYSVDVGIYNESSLTFTSLRANGSIEKRLMRRYEGIIAQAMPKNLSSIEIRDIERGTDSSGSGGPCNTFKRNVAGLVGFTHTAEDVMGTRTTGIQANPTIITGSSIFDTTDRISGFDIDTQKCTSRYGIQDLVGNMAEYSSEKIFCDYDPIATYLYDTVSANSEIPYDFEEDPYYVISNDGAPSNDLPLLLYTRPANQASECSVIQTGKTDRSSLGYSQNGFWKEIFDLFGNLDTNLVTVSEENFLDLRNLNYLRSGQDGFFLDFSSSTASLGASLLDHDQMTFKFTPDARSSIGSSYRFNPIWGIRLKTPQGDDSSIQSDQSTANTPTIIPIYDSQFLSDGITEIEAEGNIHLNNNGEPERVYNDNSDTNHFLYQFDYMTVVETPANSGIFARGTILGFSSSAPGNQIVAAKPKRYVDDNAELNIINFGSSTSGNAGRYNAHIQGKNKLNQKFRHDVGVRCAVRIDD